MKSQPHAGIPNPDHQGWEEEPAESEYSVYLEKERASRNLGALLKGQQTGSYSQALTQSSSKGKMTQSTQES